MKILLYCNWVSAVNSVTVKWPVVMVCLYFVFGICYSFYFTECCFSKALVWPPLSGHCVSVWLMDAQLPDRLMATIVRLKGQWWILHFGQSGLGCFGRTLAGHSTVHIVVWLVLLSNLSLDTLSLGRNGVLSTLSCVLVKFSNFDCFSVCNKFRFRCEFWYVAIKKKSFQKFKYDKSAFRVACILYFVGTHTLAIFPLCSNAVLQIHVQPVSKEQPAG